MKVGDVLVCLNGSEYGNGFTQNKHYNIYKIDISKNVIGDQNNDLFGFIKDDFGNNVYFRESQATNTSWEYLHVIRKTKLEKINEISKRR